jgi:hypothetical protein
MIRVCEQEVRAASIFNVHGSVIQNSDSVTISTPNQQASDFHTSMTESTETVARSRSDLFEH